MVLEATKYTRKQALVLRGKKTERCDGCGNPLDTHTAREYYDRINAGEDVTPFHYNKDGEKRPSCIAGLDEKQERDAKIYSITSAN
ncbi:MAG: hypothetical protein V1870_00175 [Candidatus Aenigmatarchaeota archaeon]